METDAAEKTARNNYDFLDNKAKKKIFPNPHRKDAKKIPKLLQKSFIIDERRHTY